MRRRVPARRGLHGGGLRRPRGAHGDCHRQLRRRAVLAAAGEANRTRPRLLRRRLPHHAADRDRSSSSATSRSPRARVVPVESEHSAMAVCIGASLAGARAFTASSSNGLLYMTENVFAAGYYRLPIVMIAVQPHARAAVEHLGRPGRHLALRDAAWLQFYSESHQDLVGHDPARVPRRRGPARAAARRWSPRTASSSRTRRWRRSARSRSRWTLPAAAATCRTVCARPPSDVRRHDLAARDTQHHRAEIQAGDGARAGGARARPSTSSSSVFGRRPHGALPAEHDRGRRDSCSSPATRWPARRGSRWRSARARGEKVGLVQAKLFRPFPARRAVRGRSAGAPRRRARPQPLARLRRHLLERDRHEPRRTRPDVLLQDYLVGLGGGDVTPAVIDEIVDDLGARDRPADRPGPGRRWPA